MNNIWKYSLVLAFSIILDQLIKGTAQSLIPTEGGTVPLFGILSFVRLRNPDLIFGISLPVLGTYSNGIALSVCSALIFLTLKKIVFYRNRNPLKGWAYTLLVTGLFTSWLDRATQGFTLDYLSVGLGNTSLPFSVGDLFFLVGAILVLILELKGKKA